jgi:hypothetical protein
MESKMSQLIKRKTVESNKEIREISSFSINSNGVFTIRFKPDKTGKELLININDKELEKLVKFIRKQKE